jgi:hypothetical protein
VDRVALTGRGVQRDAEALEQLAQLGVDVLPLADAQVVEELRPAQSPEGARRQLSLLGAYVLPQVEVGDEVRLLVGEARVLLVGSLLLVGRPLARVLDRERCRDDQHLADAAVAVGLDDHPGQSRVERELGELPAEGREALRGSDTLGSRAPSSSSSCTPSRTCRLSGGSTNGNAAMSPSPSAVICRITDARFVRRISGSVNSGRPR